MADEIMDLENLQHEVQRNLGRSMLRLQYERVLKSMVAGMAIAGPFELLQATRARQAAGASSQSLGTLVRMFTVGHLIPATSEGEKAPGDTRFSGQSVDVPWASVRFNISMSPERYAQTKDGLAELVALRNDLVHHPIERFDISDDNGCRAAASHLDSCYEQIEGYCQLLKTWATGLAETQALASSFLQSKTFEDAFVHRIDPDGTVRWEQSTIVECLKNAENACGVKGWTSLDAAINFVMRANRDQTPTRYGCKTWRQVLMRSRHFELRNETGGEAVKGKAWYRSCDGSSKTGTQ